MLDEDIWFDEPFEFIDQKDELIYECTEHVKDIIRQLYSSDKIDYRELTYNIEELCHLLKISYPENSLQIERKKEISPAIFRPNIFSEFSEFTLNYANALTT